MWSASCAGSRGGNSDVMPAERNQCVTVPCVYKVLAQAVEVRRVGVANGIMSFGYLLGPAVGTLVGGYLMMKFGWRAGFLVLGGLSFLWLWPWRRVVIPSLPRGPAG